MVFSISLIVQELEKAKYLSSDIFNPVTYDIVLYVDNLAVFFFPLNFGQWTLTMNIAATTMS